MHRSPANSKEDLVISSSNLREIPGIGSIRKTLFLSLMAMQLHGLTLDDAYAIEERAQDIDILDRIATPM